MVSLRRALHACLVLVSAGGLTACRSSEPGDPRAQATALYSSIVTRVYGTPEQREAGDERAWWAAQIVTVECMARAGVDYRVLGYSPLMDREPVAPGDLLGFAPAGADFDVADQLHRLSATTINATHTARQAHASGAGWAAATRQCAAEADAAALPRVPDGQEHLDGALVQELTRVQAAAAPTLAADYRACLRANGIVAADRTALRVQVEQAFPTTGLGMKSALHEMPDWAYAVTFERKAASVDAGCRADAVEVVMASALPGLTTFAAVHADQLTEVAAGWARMEIEARELLRDEALPED
jgi:hypothetical protein